MEEDVIPAWLIKADAKRELLSKIVTCLMQRYKDESTQSRVATSLGQMSKARLHEERAELLFDLAMERVNQMKKGCDL